MVKPRYSLQEVVRRAGEAMLGVDRAVSAAAAGKDRPPGEMIELWLDSKLLQASGLAPQRQPAASATQIAAAEARLGWPLPAQLCDFYRASNGIAWSAVGEIGGYFPALDQLATGGELVPPLSARQEAHWRKHRAKTGEGRRIGLYPPGVFSVLGEPECWLDFAELDPFLALQQVSTSCCLLIAQRPGLAVPVGHVLDVENLMATHFESLAHWLSVQLCLGE
ncbi:SMI1/KNR4 family protein [Azonexus sp.]|uniref:SMI1/KNR4 family protein n=1 Tax=Azonexus sp. TaxID=1872668 RepID=UPI0035B21EC7